MFVFRVFPLDAVPATIRAGRVARCGQRLATILAPLALLTAGLTSCRVVPRYDLHAMEPHKDALVITVLLDESAPAEVYRGIAETELRGALESRRVDALPLYEVSFDFRLRDNPRKPLAVLVARFAEAADTGGGEEPAARARWHTYLY